MTTAPPDPVHPSTERDALLADAARVGRYAVRLEATLRSMLSSEILARVAGSSDSAAPSIPLSEATTALLADTAAQLRRTDAAFAVLRSAAPAHPVATA